MIEVDQVIGGNATLVPARFGGNRIDVEVIGYSPDKSLMLSVKDKSLDLSVYKKNKRFHLRLNRGNVVYNFNAKILSTQSEPSKYIRISLPTNTRMITERKKPRFEIDKQKINLSVDDGDQMVPASMIDVSYNGACLLSRQRLGNVNDEFKIELQMPGDKGVVYLPCQLRYVRTNIGVKGQDCIVFHHGMEFGGLSENAESFLVQFVSNASNLN